MASKSTKKIILIISVTVVVFVGFGIAARTMGWLGDESGTLVETSKAERKSITQLVSASGIVRPEVEVIITPDVSGEIIELTVKEGDFVNQGDLLLRIRPDLYQARIDEIQATLYNTRAREQQARAGMLRSQLNYQKQQELYNRNLIPEMEYVTAKTQYEADEANYRAAQFSVQSTEASLRRAQEELRQTVIRAPMTGTISRLNVERGERVVGSVQMTGTEILRIARMEQMEIEVRVNENDIMKVSLGDTARVMVDAYSGRNFEGIVTEIANSAIRRAEGTAEQISEYVVKIRITTPHNLSAMAGSLRRQAQSEIQDEEMIPYFKPGMSASVDVETQTVFNVVAVPIQAVTVRDFASLRNASQRSDTVSVETASASGTTGGQVRREDIRRVVFVVSEGQTKMVEVETGINDDQNIQILRGLDEGDEIVTGNYRILSRQLRDGDRVRTAGNNN